MRSKILVSSALVSTMLLSQVNISDATEKNDKKSEISDVIKDKDSKIKGESQQIKVKNSVHNQADNDSSSQETQKYSEPGKFESDTGLYNFGVGDSRSGAEKALNTESKMSDSDVSIKHKDVVNKKSNIAYVLTPSGKDDNMYYSGTAFAIDKHTLITNNHVIRDHNDDSGYKPYDTNQIKINPNRDTSKEYVPQEITPTNIKMLKSADAAIITVKEDLSKTMTINKLASEDFINNLKQNDDITVSGYPGSENHVDQVGGSYGPKGTPYDAKSKFISNATSIHPVTYYKGYFEKGMSGSPIYNKDGDIIGLHAGAVGTENGNKADVGFGYTFTKDLRKDILKELPQLDESIKDKEDNANDEEEDNTKDKEDINKEDDDMKDSNENKSENNKDNEDKNDTNENIEKTSSNADYDDDDQLSKDLDNINKENSNDDINETSNDDTSDDNSSNDDNNSKDNNSKNNNSDASNNNTSNDNNSKDDNSKDNNSDTSNNNTSNNNNNNETSNENKSEEENKSNSSIKVQDGLDKNVDKQKEDSQREKANEKTKEKSQNKDKKDKDNKNDKKDRESPTLTTSNNDNNNHDKDKNKNKDKDNDKDKDKNKDNNNKEENNNKLSANNQNKSEEKPSNDDDNDKPKNEETIEPSSNENNNNEQDNTPLQQAKESLPDTGSTIGNIGLYGGIFSAAVGGLILLSRKFLTK